MLAIRPELRELDTKGLAEQFSCGCTLQGRTLFKRLKLLPPASCWTVGDQGNARRGKYFDPKLWEDQDRLAERSYRHNLQETFSRVLPRYFGNPETIGMSLTGGLDGRMIMAFAPSRAGNFPCYTFGGPYRDCADVSIARQVAKVTGHSHKVLPIGNDFLCEFRKLAEASVYLSDGTMDVGGAVEIYANRMARDVAPVRLTGNYGSEILRSNVAFRPARKRLDCLSDGFSDLMTDAESVYDHERQGHPLSFVAFKQVPWHHYSRFSVEQSQLTIRSPYLDNDLVSLAYRVPIELRKSPAPALHLVAEKYPRLAKIPTDRGLLHSPRPFLDGFYQTWQEATVRAEYVYDYGMPHWLARLDSAFRSFHLERLFLGRHKFYHFRVWYRDQLAAFVRDILLDSKSLSRPYLCRRAVEQIVSEHTSGSRNHTTRIHKLVTAELMHRTLLEERALHWDSRIRSTVQLTSR